MTEVLFYHLEHARLETVLPGLLEKTLQRDWRAVVRCGQREVVERLDEYLWVYDDASFLPHSAVSNVADVANEPIWLTDTTDLANKPDILFLVEGALAEPDEFAGLKRCVTIFDGGNDEAVAKARNFWKVIKSAGLVATYWRQSDGGRWEKQG